MAQQPQLIVLSAQSQKLLTDYVKEAYNLWDASKRKKYMEWMDRQYARRLDLSSATVKSQLLAAAGNPTKFRNIIYPIIMPQVEAAVGYQSEVFCSGTPLFPVCTSPQDIDAGTMLETVLDSQAETGGWATAFTKVFRDAYKYNIGGLHCAYETRLAPAGTQTEAAGKQESRKVIWAGNVVERLDMYNTFYDTRVEPHEVSLYGEFAGFIKVMPRTLLRRTLEELPVKYVQNFGAAYDSVPGGSFNKRHYIPDIGTNMFRVGALTQAPRDWFQFFNIDIQAKQGKGRSLGQLYEVITCYVRICPRDFGIRAVAPSIPQIFKVVIVNWDNIVQFVPVQTELGYLPVLITQAIEDGLGHDTGSLAENIEDFQQLASGMMNSGIAARRRAISDRAIYNGALIDPTDVESDEPNAKIRLRSNIMFSNVTPANAYYSIPFNDTISTVAIQEAATVADLANLAAGTNRAQQGQFVKGNKSRTEFNSIMSFGDARNRQTALHFEARLFTPLKAMLKYNVVENQGAETLYSRDKKALVNINPQQLRDTVMAFKLSDGQTPASREVSSDMLQVMLQMVPQIPALSQAYDAAAIASQIFRAGGVDVSQYKFSPEVAAYNQAMQAWQQAAAEAAKAGTEFKSPQPTPPQTGVQ